MKLSVFYHHIADASAQTGRSLSDLLDYIKKLGIDYVEVDMNDLINSENLVRNLDEHGLKISSVYSFYNFGVSTDCTDGFAHIDRVAAAGCDKIMLIPGFYSSADNDTRTAELNSMVNAMKEMCVYAVSKGLTPTIEDFDDSNSPICDAEGMLCFAEQISQLKITFDTGNFMYSERSETEAYAMLKDKIVHVHCKDRSLDSNSKGEVKLTTGGRALYPSPVGDGSIKMREIVTSLKAAGYDGIYTIEHFGTENQLGFIEKSVKNLKEWLE